MDNADAGAYVLPVGLSLGLKPDVDTHVVMVPGGLRHIGRDAAVRSAWVVASLEADFEVTSSLDELHLAFTEYLGSRLTPAPLDELRPRRILELGWEISMHSSIYGSERR
jgi:hypothetical protein